MHDAVVNCAQTAASKKRKQVHGASYAHASIWKKNQTSRDSRHQTSAYEIDVRRLNEARLYQGQFGQGNKGDSKTRGVT
jgi:hypothetical protein